MPKKLPVEGRRRSFLAVLAKKSRSGNINRQNHDRYDAYGADRHERGDLVELKGQRGVGIKIGCTDLNLRHFEPFLEFLASKD